ncbi:hypothetical protein Cabys_2901 [Caldithrix abyssi DSM 13497]|uniref:Uncharacterized protein n=1 Tax=Caldithrix abyssi DSM 13497 TaxID=880073 RepID=A0A1J1CBK7_CALAY|nr:hypothetical protein Cabys_2901 [Caldithrix abyssi DSM 13497]
MRLAFSMISLTPSLFVPPQECKIKKEKIVKISILRENIKSSILFL